MSGKVIHNLEELAEGIGSYIGMMQGVEQQTYVNTLLDSAFAKTVPMFNAFAAGRAMKDPESYGHMWEFGTSGITRGRPKYANPANPQAMLWTTVMTGEGKTKNISFVFRKAKSFVPPHTTESTGGVDQKVLDRLAVNTGRYRYRFPNKAYVYESGVDVNVMPKRAKKMFVPTEVEGLPAGSKDTGKGYVWTKGSHTWSPGEMSGSTGAFTSMFGGFWLGPGGESMFKFMAADLETDLLKAQGLSKPRGRMTTAQAANIKAAVQRGEVKARKPFTLKVRQEANARAEVFL